MRKSAAATRPPALYQGRPAVGAGHAVSGPGRAERLDRFCYTVAGILVLSGIAHLGVQVVDGGPWSGPVSWRKPISFGIAFGVALATLTWVSTYVAISRHLRTRLLVAFATACVVEVTAITTQAWRGVPSHFNVSTPVNAAFAYSAAAGGAVLIAVTLLFSAASWRAAPAQVPPSLTRAVRVGFATFLLALAVGAAMIALGVTATRTESQQAAYSAPTPLIPLHAALMHGILILPGIGWLSSYTSWPEAQRVRIVTVACTGFVLTSVAVALYVASSNGPWGVAVIAAVLGLLGVLGVVVPVVALLTNLNRTLRSAATTARSEADRTLKSRPSNKVDTRH